MYIYMAGSVLYLSSTRIQITHRVTYLITPAFHNTPPEPLWAEALSVPLGPCGRGPCGPPWALVRRALVGPLGLPLGVCGRALVGPPGPLWTGPLWAALGPCVPGPCGPPWALMGPALMGITRIYIYICICIYVIYLYVKGLCSKKISLVGKISG